ncbi:Long-chain-fatty-acid--CoA ligase FadD15 [Posidoniimonas corsicana]|uniref:Long-chain-fatty-acid--CoA ligase FadD15 n=2 Tax=Posidoniimonas corsicana TaxID=1938618 RepID=A0A5C5V3C4_9BACT|nr:Long-chain-fatty-acid--CoA ligase FadD15 [Posidoniimonas corsicana]
MRAMPDNPSAADPRPDIARLFTDTVRRKPDAPALGVIDGGQLSWRTWAELDQAVDQARGELQELGVGEGDIVAHCGPNSPRWIARDLAMLSLGVVHAPLAESIIDRCPLPLYRGQRRRLLSGELVRVARLPPEHRVATLAMTSGTSGEPLAAMLTQANLSSNATAVSDAVGGDGSEVRLSFLPHSHLYARVCDLYAWVYRGSRLALAERRETLMRDIKLVEPTSLNGVPYFYQKVLDHWRADREAGGKSSLREALGGRVRQCFCGGAALSPAVQQAFADEGAPLMNGYGLSEAAPVVAASSLAANKVGTVGPPLAGVEVRVADDGELLVRGPNVMLGYWNNDEATRRVLRDGWLHTGDLGELDEQGRLTVTGRKKEALVLSTGRNASPSRLESLLCASPWVEQACVVGDGRKHLSALIVPNPDRVRGEIRQRRLWVFSRRQALRHTHIREVFAREIAEQLTGLPQHEQIERFTLIPRGFSIERGELTAKLSLRRSGIEQSFRREIEAMYH